jgi:hypothetical protein
MFTRFDILLVTLLVYFLNLVFGSRIPERLLYFAIIVILLVLLLLGVVRY